MGSKTRYQSLRRRSDFLNLKAAGQVFHVNSWLLVNFQKTDSKDIRCGWTIPRQVGPAVLRNRFRRWGREYMRKWSAENPDGMDVNFVFKRRDKGFYNSVSHEEFNEVMDKFVAKLKHSRR